MSKKYKGTPAEKALFIEPKLNLIYQVDERLNENINKFGCRFMSMLAIPQIVNNKTLTPEGILKIYHESIDMGPNVMQKDCTCGPDEHKIMSLGFELLGDNDRFCRQIFISDSAGKYRSENFLPSENNIIFMVVDFNTSSGPAYGGHHFMLFNGVGDLIYDPGKGTVDKSMLNMNRWLCYKVYSRAKQNEMSK